MSDTAATTGNETIDTRQRILEAAVREFADKGYDGATTVGIARSAGVAQPLVHYHFSNKRTLWNAAVDSVFSEFRAVHEQVFENLRDLDRLAQMKVLARHTVGFFARHPELPRILNQEGQLGGERLGYLVERHIRPMVERLQAAVEKGRMLEGWRMATPFEDLVFFWLGAASQPFQAPALAKELFGLDVHSAEAIRRYADTFIEMIVGETITKETAP